MPYSLFDKYKQPDGTFADGTVQGDSITSFLCRKFGFCVCGQPEVALLYTKIGLSLLADLKGRVWEKQETFDTWQARCMAHFGSMGSEYFFWYWLNHNDWAEHGGAMPGWLTDEGELLLALLGEWSGLKEPEFEED